MEDSKKPEVREPGANPETILATPMLDALMVGQPTDAQGPNEAELAEQERKANSDRIQRQMALFRQRRGL